MWMGGVVQGQQRALVLGNFFANLEREQLHLRGLFGFLDGAQPAIALPPQGQGILAPTRFKEGVELREVHFHYPGGDQDAPVLQGVNARLPAGKRTALGGANRAGKSPPVKLLTPMYPPTRGRSPLPSTPPADLEP